jgi:putative transposase
VRSGFERTISISDYWQRRFWEHAISDDDDLGRHVDYIHFNPVKHGLVKKAKDWQWSSFHRYVQEGYYGADWGRASEYWDESKFGE